MITAEKFLDITNEVIKLINIALYQLFKNYPEEYVLFLTSGEFNEVIARNKSMNISPYTISCHNMDNYYDYTRQFFLCEFLNTYYGFSDNGELQDNEYRMNIEFLIYTHIWEAKTFLKKLYRLANLLDGKEYDWKVKIPTTKKSDFIKDKIVKPFNSANCLLVQTITNNYNTDLRNAIAHSDYQIDMNSKKIMYYAKKGSCTTSFDDWGVHFAYSVCLAYYFSDIVTKRRKTIIRDWGNNCFTIKMPFSDGSIKHVHIQYLVERDDFAFIKK
jgi:hypothetical protein